MLDPNDIPLTGEEAAAFLKVPAYTLTRLTREGKIPSRRIGRNLYYKPSDLLAYFDSLPTVERTG